LISKQNNSTTTITKLHKKAIAINKKNKNDVKSVYQNELQVMVSASKIKLKQTLIQMKPLH
jgi:hypothetical protein